MSARSILTHIAPAREWLFAALAMLVTAAAIAHTGGTTGLASIAVSGQTVQYNIQMPVGAITPQLAEAMHLGQPGVAPDWRPLLTLVSQKIHIRADLAACEPIPGTITPPL